MLKIRDLGITFIPGTMQPPEIGMGGGYDAANPPQNPPGDPPGNPPNPCAPSIGKPPGCVPTPQPCQPTPPPRGFEAAGFSPEAVSELRQQLHMQLR